MLAGKLIAFSLILTIPVFCSAESLECAMIKEEILLALKLRNQDDYDRRLQEAVTMGNMDPRAAQGYYQEKLNRSIRNLFEKKRRGQELEKNMQFYKDNCEK